MAALSSFLLGAIGRRRLVIGEPPSDRGEHEAEALLADAYRTHALTVAGLPIPFDPAAAVAAGKALYRAAWYLLNANLPVEEAGLRMPADPHNPSQHLSADLALRLLPAVYRRARALRAGDPLTDCLADLLRRWPLSGVLADVTDPPLTPLDFGGHPGLRLLYAERLARHDKPGWFPTGPALEAVELVWQDLGRDPNVLSLARQVAASVAGSEPTRQDPDR
jgi:hypothetical protein